MLDITRFKHRKRICLQHDAECYLLGIDHEGKIFAEEYYENAYFAQYSITKDGVIITKQDEDFGKNDLIPLELPNDMILPHHPLEHPLNFTGIRFRGLREQDRVSEWVQPLSIMEKMPLLQVLQLTIPPIMILGIAESRVLSETSFSETESIVCRRLRLLYALPETNIDDEGLPYDYDSVTFHIIHVYEHEEDLSPPLHAALQHFADLSCPMDCIYHEGTLIVANGSKGDKPSEIHIFQLYENNSQE